MKGWTTNHNTRQCQFSSYHGDCCCNCVNMKTYSPDGVTRQYYCTGIDNEIIPLREIHGMCEMHTKPQKTETI